MKECFWRENLARSTESSGAVSKSKSCPSSVWNVTYSMLVSHRNGGCHCRAKPGGADWRGYYIVEKLKEVNVV